MPCRLTTLAYVITDLVGRNLTKEFRCSVSTVQRMISSHLKIIPGIGLDACAFGQSCLSRRSSNVSLMDDEGLHWFIQDFLVDTRRTANVGGSVLYSLDMHPTHVHTVLHSGDASVLLLRYRCSCASSMSDLCFGVCLLWSGY